jgi:MFS family permease
MGFKKWRKSRPFWGSFVTIVSGLMILWVPINLYLSTLLPGSFAIIGLVFGGAITLIGFISMFFPNASKILGIFTIFLSILSVIGALGGFLIGTLFGIIGGSLLMAWRLAPVKIKAAPPSDVETTVPMG